MDVSRTYEVVIVGAGPAGLSAALILGRCRRRVLVFDSGEYRNAVSHGVHGFLSRDGIAPAHLRSLGREQLGQYGVEFCDARVAAARCVADGFEVTLEDGSGFAAKKMLIATGVVDHLPEIEGTTRLYGRGINHCPYCDGWEHRDQPLGVYGRGMNGAGLALSLKTWSADVVLCTDGPARLRPDEAARLDRHGIGVTERPILRFEGDGHLERIVFRSGEPLERRALFFSTGQHQRADLAASLGCRFTRKGTVRTDRLEGSNVPGLWVAGDASKDVQLAVVAAAEGAKAGIAINKALQGEEFR
jgi:thioredoxin reductase